MTLEQSGKKSRRVSCGFTREPEPLFPAHIPKLRAVRKGRDTVLREHQHCAAMLRRERDVEGPLNQWSLPIRAQISVQRTGVCVYVRAEAGRRRDLPPCFRRFQDCCSMRHDALDLWN
jgi:hypothetical protein